MVRRYVSLFGRRQRVFCFSSLVGVFARTVYAFYKGGISVPELRSVFGGGGRRARSGPCIGGVHTGLENSFYRST